MPGKPQAPHPLVDRLNRTMRFKSRETSVAVRPESTAIKPLTNTVHSNHVPDSNTEVPKAKPNDDGRSLKSNPKDLALQPKSYAAEIETVQEVEIGGRPSQMSSASTVHDSFGRAPTTHPPCRAYYATAEDGRSIGSDLKADLGGLNLHRKGAASNKRASELVSGQDQDTGRPSKLLTTYAPRQGFFYDSARDQRVVATEASPLASPAAQDSSNIWSRPDGHRPPVSPPRSTGLIPVDKVPNYSPTRQIGSNPSANHDTAVSPPASPRLTISASHGQAFLKQPETRPITQEQLVNEVKGIYAGLVMVEKKCVEIDQQQSSTTNKLSNEQWQALIALHRTLLHEHHDFFLASQHPSSSPALRRLAVKYAMPARIWRHGIHSFLELLRHRLPDSLDHMLAFVYLAYSMMALLMESVSSFEETWIECLGDLARYRITIKEVDLRDREVWSGVARIWYNKAAEKSPDVGRIQHHLAVLARPNIVQQLYYYLKALVSVVPFQNARESMMLLFNPVLEHSEIASNSCPLHGLAIVKASSILFTCCSISEYTALMEHCCSMLENHVGCGPSKFRTQGLEGCSLCAIIFDSRCPESGISKALPTFGNGRKLEAGLDAAIRSARYRIRPQNLGTFGGSRKSIGVLHNVDVASWHRHPNRSAQTHKHFSTGGIPAGHIRNTPEPHSPNPEQDAMLGCRPWLDILAIAAETSNVFQNVGHIDGTHWTQLMNSDLNSEDALTVRLLLRLARASLDSVLYWARCTLSAFTRHPSLTTKVCLLMSTLPITYAAPVSAPPPTENLGRPEAWLNFETICHILGWVFTFTLGALIVYLELRNPRRDLARYHVFSFASAGASLVRLDPRATPEVRWVTLFVGVLFLVRLWTKVTEHYDMGYGWIGPIFGLGILIDTGLVHLMVGASGGDQGLFLGLLLACFCLSLSLCASMARFYRHIYAPNLSTLPTHIRQ